MMGLFAKPFGNMARVTKSSGITVITANARDFRKLAEFRSFLWRVNNPQTT
jgi:hypothetical protein